MNIRPEPRAGSTKKFTVTKHPVRRLSATAITLLIWSVFIAGVAQAKVPPDDPMPPTSVNPPVIVTEPVSWTRYARVAVLAILISLAATLAVQAVIRSSRPSIAHV
jgi:hypothetical protein